MSIVLRHPVARSVSLFLCIALILACIPSCGTAPSNGTNNGGGNDNGGDGNGGDGGPPQAAPTVTTVDANTAYALSESGNVMGATVVTGGEAYTGEFLVEVGQRATGQMGMLMVGPRAGLANEDLTGVTVSLMRPSGQEIGAITDGAVTYAAGATVFPQPDQAVTDDLDAFITETMGIDPAADGEENLAQVISHWTNPEADAPSDLVADGLVSYIDTLRATENAVGLDNPDPMRPTLFVHNPEVGTWRVRVTSPAEVTDYGIVGLYVQTRSYISDALALEEGLPNLASASTRVGPDDPKCLEVMDSAAIDLLSFLPLELAGVANPGAPGLVSWVIGLAVGTMFIEAAAAGVMGFVFGLAFAYCLGKVVDMAFEAAGHQDRFGNAFKRALTSIVDRDAAGLSLNVFFPPGPYNPNTQVLYVGPAREFKVRRLFVNNCGALALVLSTPGSTTWQLTDGSGGSTTMGTVIDTEPEDGSWVQVRTAARGESAAAGNFYIEADHAMPNGTHLRSTVRVIYDTNPLVFP